MGVVALFRSKNTGRVFAKRFRSATTAGRAKRGLENSGQAVAVGKRSRPAKGFKYGRIVKRMNGGR